VPRACGTIRAAGPDIHHFGVVAPQNPAMDPDVRADPTVVETQRFLTALQRLSGPDLEKVALALDSDALCDEVDWWRATIAIDRVVRHARRTRLAAHAATDAHDAVEAAATRAGSPLPDAEVTKVARAAADVARGLAAGPAARPVVQLLLEYWTPVFTA
jgi:hypothetical protein